MGDADIGSRVMRAREGFALAASHAWPLPIDLSADALGGACAWQLTRGPGGIKGRMEAVRGALAGLALSSDGRGLGACVDWVELALGRHASMVNEPSGGNALLDFRLPMLGRDRPSALGEETLIVRLSFLQANEWIHSQALRMEWEKVQPGAIKALRSALSASLEAFEIQGAIGDTGATPRASEAGTRVRI